MCLRTFCSVQFVASNPLSSCVSLYFTTTFSTVTIFTKIKTDKCVPLSFLHSTVCHKLEVTGVHHNFTQLLTKLFTQPFTPTSDSQNSTNIQMFNISTLAVQTHNTCFAAVNSDLLYFDIKSVTPLLNRSFITTFHSFKTIKKHPKRT